MVRIPIQAVVCVKADGNYSTICQADGRTVIVTMQLGEMEERIADMLGTDHPFMRIGRSLIVNMSYIVYVNPARQKLTLSDCRTFHYEESASREALKQVKSIIEGR